MMKKLALIILDGWGLGDKSKADAIAQSNTPFFDSLMKNFPNATLKTSGESVGLPEGQMGNSEVGHLNIGAGRVVYQDLVKINKEIKDNSFFKNEVLLKSFEYARQNNKPIHVIGLVSDGGVHSHTDHLKAICDMAKENNIRKDQLFIHAFTDGRDTDPKSGLAFLENLETFLKTRVGQIATVIGRYYSMDRDKRWERVKIAYDMLTKGEGEKTLDVIASVKKLYDNNITDEFIKPIVRTDANGTPFARITNGDVVICFNFRTDRCREITQALTQQDMSEMGMQKLSLHYVTMTNYDNTFKNVNIVYDKDNLLNTLGDAIAQAGKKQIRIAETEKYPHVTFFFSGGREKEFEGEKRIMVPSPKVATYDLQPEMSANEVTEAIVTEINKNETDFICLNFANPDMVGHTGVYNAIIKAVETIDSCLQKVVEAGIKNGYSFIIIADHGNADYVINEDGSPNTAHTTNPVPVILIDSDHKKIKPGKLADLAPTILKIMGLNIPKEMTGEILV